MAAIQGQDSENQQQGQEAQPVQIGALSIPQLRELRNKLTEEANQLSGNFNQLINALQRFEESKRILGQIKLAEKGNPIMIPLSDSMYVPGTLEENESVTVELGTGYFVRRSVPQAEEIIQRKITFLEKNTDALEAQILSKRNNIESISGLINYKVKQELAEQNTGTNQ